MGTMTAQILVGSPHHVHDGILPTHTLFLQENSVPAWILTLLPLYGEHTRPREVVWIPSVEDMLEDALLMIAVQILHDDGVVAFADSFAPGIAEARVELVRLFSREQREQLHEECRRLASFPKLVISALDGSTVMAQLHVVEHYRMDVEVCPSVYQRLFSSRRAETVTRGLLPHC